MSIILVTGDKFSLLQKYDFPKIKIHNKSPLFLTDMTAYFDSFPASFDTILITDEALTSNHEHNLHQLELLLHKLKILQVNNPIAVVLLTKDIQWKKEISYTLSQYTNLHLEFHPYIRPTISIIQNAIEGVHTKQHSSRTWFKRTEKEETTKEASPVVEKKPSFLDRLRSKSKQETERSATELIDKEFERVSRGVSRVVAITGHRGSGVTSTLVNIASEASKRGLSTMIIDLDIDFRTTNMYFNQFHERAQKDEHISASLIRTLARPQDFMTTSCHLREELWITSLGYSCQDKMLIEQYFTSSKLIALLSVMRSKFNLILLDLPMELIGNFHEALIHIDTIGLCVSNNIYSVVTTLKGMEAELKRDTISYLNAKSKLVVTKYNDRSKFQNEIFIPETVSKVLTSGLLDSYMHEVKVAGYVPYLKEFDEQIETDLPIVFSNRDHEQAYGNILLRLMEGTK
ncbi:AAA family ATPase [Paenibacillus sp. GSMTC-2017]|uniref:AAA family ATPase n=1 Tax=Paenibacillus sp. GSMTC-2017 TaxID=2794350 RepID=UPI0018D87CFB|nr:AAA family ATPase [Paenibacillus sp. GSMTC-2017]MBH5320049.1 AAA family ATPase [Paenibacillus sp. GSMTC-2017]